MWLQIRFKAFSLLGRVEWNVAGRLGISDRRTCPTFSDHSENLWRMIAPLPEFMDFELFGEDHCSGKTKSVTFFWSVHEVSSAIFSAEAGCGTRAWRPTAPPWPRRSWRTRRRWAGGAGGGGGGVRCLSPHPLVAHFGQLVVLECLAVKRAGPPPKKNKTKGFSFFQPPLLST